VLIIFVEVAAGGIGLPDFNEGVANGPAIFIHNAAAHFNAFAERLALCWRVKSKAFGEAISFGKAGPVISDRVMGIATKGCLGARLMEDTYGGYR